MKNTMMTILGGLVLMFSASAVRAQQADHWLTLNAPFAFQMENTQLPAGEYRLLLQESHLLVLGKDGKAGAVALTLPLTATRTNAKEVPTVVFHDYNGRYFLAQIWTSTHDKGRELLQTKEEQHLARQEKMIAVNLAASPAAGK